MNLIKLLMLDTTGLRVPYAHVLDAIFGPDPNYGAKPQAEFANQLDLHLGFGGGSD
jgi:hypothetical protein